MPGLDLTVRQVAQNSYGAGVEVAHIRIPSIPALPPAPADTSDVDATVEYLDNVDLVVEAHATAWAAAKKAAKRIRRADLRNENSEIAGALSAMVQVLPPSSKRTAASWWCPTWSRPAQRPRSTGTCRAPR